MDAEWLTSMWSAWCRFWGPPQAPALLQVQGFCKTDWRVSNRVRNINIDSVKEHRWLSYLKHPLSRCIWGRILILTRACGHRHGSGPKHAAKPRGHQPRWPSTFSVPAKSSSIGLFEKKSYNWSIWWGGRAGRLMKIPNIAAGPSIYSTRMTSMKFNWRQILLALQAHGGMGPSCVPHTFSWKELASPSVPHGKPRKMMLCIQDIIIVGNSQLFSKSRLYAHWCNS